MGCHYNPSGHCLLSPCECILLCEDPLCHCSPLALKSTSLSSVTNSAFILHSLYSELTGTRELKRGCSEIPGQSHFKQPIRTAAVSIGWQGPVNKNVKGKTKGCWGFILFYFNLIWVKTPKKKGKLPHPLRRQLPSNIPQVNSLGHFMVKTNNTASHECSAFS